MQVTENLFRPRCPSLRCPSRRCTPSCSPRSRACRRRLVSDLQVLDSVQCHHPGLQQREIEAQKNLVEQQREDTTQLHVASYVQKSHQREMEMKAEMDKYSNPHIKR